MYLVSGWLYIFEMPPEATNLVAVASGYEHIVALRGDGVVVASLMYPLREPPQGELASVPSGLSNVVSVVAGRGTQ